MLYLVIGLVALACRFLFHCSYVEVAYWCFVVWCFGMALAGAGMMFPRRVKE